MKNSTEMTIDQVSKEIKNAISKLGTPTLLRKYNDGDFEGERQVAAKYYLEKRGALPEEVATTQTTTFGRHRSEMSEQELAAAEQKLSNTISKNKAKANLVQETAVEQLVQKGKNVMTLPTGAGKGKIDKKIVDEKKPAKEKQPAEPIMKLTEQESKLFEVIKGQCKDGIYTQPFNNPFKSLREYKGVLGSLKKKGIVSYDNDTLHLSVENIGIQMIQGQLPYKQKTKHEQNFFKKARVTVKVDGKDLEKSAYVRMLLRKSNHISCSELNDSLAKVGFSKLYHSELQRCKTQLGIVTDKNKD